MNQTKLFNYAKPYHAAVTLKKLRAKWPDRVFVPVQSPLQSYAFRWLIAVLDADGKPAAYVEKCKF